VVGHTTKQIKHSRLKMSHSGCALLPHFQPLVHHISVSPSLPCIICIASLSTGCHVDDEDDVIVFVNFVYILKRNKVVWFLDFQHPYFCSRYTRYLNCEHAFEYSILSCMCLQNHTCCGWRRVCSGCIRHSTERRISDSFPWRAKDLQAVSDSQSQ